MLHSTCTDRGVLHFRPSRMIERKRPVCATGRALFMKLCTKCSVVKPIEMFCKSKSTRDGLQWRCKSCSKEYARAYNAKFPGNCTARLKIWRSENREKNRATKKAWRNKNKEKVRHWKKKRKYGISLIGTNELLVMQGGLCAICGKDIKNNFHIDHDHLSKKVRGLLCPGCNIGIGHLKESIPVLNGAIAYIQKHLVG